MEGPGETSGKARRVCGSTVKLTPSRFEPVPYNVVLLRSTFPY